MTDYQNKTDIEFYALEGPTTFLMSCRYCNGTGKSVLYMNDDLSIIEYGTGTCSVCNGRGVVRFESSDVPITHGGCDGTGRQWIKNTTNMIMNSAPLESPHYCFGCKGYGIVSLMGEIKNLSGDPYHDRNLESDKQWFHPGNCPSVGMIQHLEQQFGRPISKRYRPPDPNVLPYEDYRNASPLITVLEMLGEHKFTTPCRHCDQTGLAPITAEEDLTVTLYSDLSECPVCKGRKVLRLESWKLPVVHGKCRGTGRERHIISGVDPDGNPFETNLVHPCVRCHGFGIFVSDEDGPFFYKEEEVSGIRSLDR